MKKLTLLILSVCIVFAVSCSNGLDANASTSQSGVSGTDNPADLIPPDEGTGSMTAVASFINKYKGVYYEYVDGNDNGTTRPYGVVRYKFRDGQIHIIDGWNKATDITAYPVQAILPSQNKLQLSNYQKGEILVLNMSDKGLESYVSYILEKVSDDVLIKNNGIGGYVEEFAQYKGTYNSVAEDNKIENYIAIDEEGNIFFHDEKVTVASGRVKFTEGEGLTIAESYKDAYRNIIFKFDQGVYRRYSIDGGNRDLTYIGVCEVTKDFIEDLPFGFSTYVSGRTIPDKYPNPAREFFTFNQPEGTFGFVNATGSVWFTAKVYSEGAGREIYSGRGDLAANVIVLKGKDLILMGPYWNAKLTFNDDYTKLTHKLKDGTEVVFTKQDYTINH